MTINFFCTSGVVEKQYLDFVNAALSGQSELVLRASLAHQTLRINATDELTSEKVIQSLEENVRQFLTCSHEDENSLR